MRSINMRAKTGADGALHLSVPTETPDQEYDVIVYLHPRIADWPPGYFDETFGSIMDETFFPELNGPEEQAGS